MKYFEATMRSLICSLFIGAVLFICIPMAIEIITSTGKISRILACEWYPFGILYGIYGAIQIVLSVINGIQADHLGDDIDPWGMRILYNFFLAEFSLYLIVYVIMVSLIPAPLMILVVFVFSIPYIICCTASVYIFRYYLRRMPNMMKAPSELDTSGFIPPQVHTEKDENA